MIIISILFITIYLRLFYIIYWFILLIAFRPGVLRSQTVSIENHQCCEIEIHIKVICRSHVRSFVERLQQRFLASTAGKQQMHTMEK